MIFFPDRFFLAFLPREFLLLAAARVHAGARCTSHPLVRGTLGGLWLVKNEIITW